MKLLTLILILLSTNIVLSQVYNTEQDVINGYRDKIFPEAGKIEGEIGSIGASIKNLQAKGLGSLTPFDRQEIKRLKLLELQAEERLYRLTAQAFHELQKPGVRDRYLQSLQNPPVPTQTRPSPHFPIAMTEFDIRKINENPKNGEFVIVKEWSHSAPAKIERIQLSLPDKKRLVDAFYDENSLLRHVANDKFNLPDAFEKMRVMSFVENDIINYEKFKTDANLLFKLSQDAKKVKNSNELLRIISQAQEINKSYSKVLKDFRKLQAKGLMLERWYANQNIVRGAQPGDYGYLIGTPQGDKLIFNRTGDAINILEKGKKISTKIGKGLKGVIASFLLAAGVAAQASTDPGVEESYNENQVVNFQGREWARQAPAASK